jgi:hypothetical protein
MAWRRTWALTPVLDDESFLHQTLEADEERADMFFDALIRSATVYVRRRRADRIHYMFWRYRPTIRRTRAGRECREAVAEMYVRMDELVGDTLAE